LKKLEEIFLVELVKKKKQNGDETHDLMDGLRQIRDEEGNKLMDKEVLDNIVSLVAAGYESTSIASTWAVYYLSKFPNVLDKLRVL
jgi:cytochrome P450